MSKLSQWVRGAVASQCVLPRTIQPIRRRWPPGVWALVAALSVSLPLGHARAQGLSPEAFAEGAGQWLVDRASDEISYYAVDLFVYRICREQSKDFLVTARELLPKACAFVWPEGSGAVVASTTVGLGVFRAALRQDFEALADNITRKAIAHLTPTKAGSSCDALTALVLAQKVLGALEAYARERPLALALPDAPDLLRLCPDSKTGWDDATKVLQGLDLATWEPPARLPDEDAITHARRQLHDVLWGVEAVLREALSEDRRALVAAAFEVVHRLVDKDFSGALAHLLGRQAFRDIVERALARQAESADDQKSQKRWAQTAMRLMSLAADLSTTTTAAGVQTVFETFAAPLGTWRGKYEKSHNWSLQGYAGISGGVELVPGEDDSAGGVVAPHLSFGVQYARSGTRWRFPILYGSLVDLGNVVSVRADFGSESDRLAAVEATPDVTWAHLFAPGLHFGTSLGQSPVDVLIGAKYVPILRTVGGDQRDVVQFTLDLVVDVTLMTLN